MRETTASFPCSNKSKLRWLDQLHLERLRQTSRPVHLAATEIPGASMAAGFLPCHTARMQPKTDGRVVRLLTKHLAAEDRAVEQWFLVAIGDDEKAKERISKSAKGGNEVVEVIGTILATRLASLGLTDGEIRLVLPGEPITES